MGRTNIKETPPHSIQTRLKHREKYTEAKQQAKENDKYNKQLQQKQHNLSQNPKPGKQLASVRRKGCLERKL